MLPNQRIKVRAGPRRESPPAKPFIWGPWMMAACTSGGLLCLCLYAVANVNVPKVNPKPAVVEAAASAVGTPEVAGADPFEPKEPKAPASPLAKVLPEPGQVWVLRPISGDPFEPKQAGMVTVIAVKQGWVRYGTTGVHDSDERKELSRFLLVFQPAPK